MASCRSMGRGSCPQELQSWAGWRDRDTAKREEDPEDIPRDGRNLSTIQVYWYTALQMSIVSRNEAYMFSCRKTDFI